MIGAASADAAQAFIEIGLLTLLLAGLSRVASGFGLSAVPFYLIAGLALGEGGIADLGVSEEFVALGAEIGVLLLLLALGLEYTSDELRHGLKTGVKPGLVDFGLNFTCGFAAGLLLGWSNQAALILGGVTWVSSSGVISKVLTDLDRVGNRETPSILNLLVIEDLAMAVYLPLAAALVIGGSLSSTATTVLIALSAVGVVLWLSLNWGYHMSSRLDRGNNEALLLAVFGLTLLVGGLAQELQISAAVGAFLVGLALSGQAQERASALIEPLKDLFAAIFFVFFSFQIAPGDLASSLLPAVVLGVLTAATKVRTGAFAASRVGVSRRGQIRAGTTLIARGEFSIVVASLASPLPEATDVGVLSAAYVLFTAVLGPVAAKHANRLADLRLFSLLAARS